jgi:RNA ligase (TIGR02306 family)
MSEFAVEVVKIGPVMKHPNADQLEMTMVHGGYPAIFKSGQFKEGDLAVYVPVDAIVPEEERWAFLRGHNRVKAVRLRGIFSLGILTEADPSWTEGQDVQQELRIERYCPEEEKHNAPRGAGHKNFDNDERGEHVPAGIPVYDLEALRKHGKVFTEGEEVVVTEKIHGENMRAVFLDGRLWIGSRTRWKADIEASQWWKAARAENLADTLSMAPGMVVFAECYGYTGGFPYDSVDKEPRMRVFDVLDTKTGKFLGHADLLEFCSRYCLPTVPYIYVGPWNEDVRSFANGQSTLNDSHMREGCVIRPLKERWDHRCGRVVLKLVGEQFLLRKGA